MSAGAERESKGNTFSHEFDANPKVCNCVQYSHHDCRSIGSDDYYVCQKCLGRMWNKSIPQGRETAKFRTRSLANRLMLPR